MSTYLVESVFYLHLCSVNRDKGSEASQTLQMAPLIPPGQSWANLQQYQEKGIQDGVLYPGGISFLRTEGNQWSGTFGRPGNPYQDSLSAISHLNSSFYESYHTFGVDWEPGEYLRWYVDGIFAYEINPNALLQTTGEVDGESTCEMIPFVASYSNALIIASSLLQISLLVRE